MLKRRRVRYSYQAQKRNTEVYQHAYIMGLSSKEKCSRNEKYIVKRKFRRIGEN